MSQPFYPAPPAVPQFPTTPADPPRTPWIAAYIAVGAVVTVAVLDLISALLGIIDYQQVIEAIRAGDAESGALTIAAAGVALLEVVATVLAAVAFITWLFMARRNCNRLGGYAEWAPGWAIGGWFIPFGSLYIPFKVTLDVRDASETYDPNGSAERVLRAPVGWWWATFILMNASSGISEGIEASALEKSSLESLLAARPSVFGAALFAAAATIACAALASVVVLRITRLQQATAQVHAADAARKQAALFTEG